MIQYWWLWRHKMLKRVNEQIQIKIKFSFVFNSIEDGCQVDSLYTDFSKAFDRVCQCLLLDKMSGDIDPVCCQWLRSYFSGRIQRIIMGDYVSRDILITSGVRQDSHLGPLCFIWFANEIAQIFKYVRVFFLCWWHETVSPCAWFLDWLKIQSDLNRLVDWCGANSLELNVGKCKTVEFPLTCWGYYPWSC
jgi:hypothetical protein